MNRIIGKKIHIDGIVQGVGFRPFVYSTARALNISGWVRNSSSGVDIIANGHEERMQAFIKTLRDNPPPLSVIDSIHIAEIDPDGFDSFEIIPSDSDTEKFVPISPDVSICDDCRRELFDPSNRRFRYPFINCTNCGPRFTIIKGIPYDRAFTTMKPFEMCDSCRLEYENPIDRRFHAQPTACPECGPRIWLVDDEGNHFQEENGLKTARMMINEGKILAVKGLGGFHLACDAHNQQTIEELRNDNLFKQIVFQKIGERGYGAIADPETKFLLMHPNKSLIDKDLSFMQEKYPKWWQLYKQSLQEDSCGDYIWIEEDGTDSNKYLCSKSLTINNKRYVFAVTAYSDDMINIMQFEKEIFAQNSIKQKAIDVARQIEIYIKLNPDKTIKDLQNDSYFQEIAIQQVGKTGYTAVTDYDTLTCRFHKNPAIIDMDLSLLSEKLPGFWNIMSKTKGGYEAEGTYDWEEADGSIKQKYMYIALVNAKTADGVGLHVAATTYLDEYEEIVEKLDGTSEKEILAVEQAPLVKTIFWFLGFLVALFLIILVLTRLGIIKFEKKTILIMPLIILILIIGFMLVSGLIFISFRFYLPYLFTNETNVINEAAKLLFVAAFFQIFDGVQIIGLGNLRGMADVKFPTYVAMFSYWGLGIPSCYLFGVIFNIGAQGVWIGYLIGLFSASVFLTIRFWRKSKLLIRN